MSASLEISNASEFQATLKRYLAVCSRELPNALNNKMFFIARGASRYSPKADRAEMEKSLGVVGYRALKGKKGQPLFRKGKLRFEKLYSNKVTLAALIVNARLGRAGKKGLRGQEMREAMAKLISTRASAVGTIKAGWWNAIRIFGAAVGATPSKEVNVNRLKGKTVVEVAKHGFTPQASLEYLVNSYTDAHQQYIDKRTQDGLRKAYADEMRSMEEYIIKKLQKQADALSR